MQFTMMLSPLCLLVILLYAKVSVSVPAKIGLNRASIGGASVFKGRVGFTGECLRSGSGKTGVNQSVPVVD